MERLGQLDACEMIGTVYFLMCELVAKLLCVQGPCRYVLRQNAFSKTFVTSSRQAYFLAAHNSIVRTANPTKTYS